MHPAPCVQPASSLQDIPIQVGPGAELPVALSEFLGFEVLALRLSTRR